MADHGEGLWGSAPDERIERGVARLQGMLGPEEVLSPSLQGGRSPAAASAAHSLGRAGGGSSRTDTALAGQHPTAGPQPGSSPSRCRPRVLTRDGQVVRINSRGLISGDPGRLRTSAAAEPLVIEAWAGPWPIDELWWDAGAARQVARFQLVAVDGSAWLLIVENDQWWVEARYE